MTRRGRDPMPVEFEGLAVYNAQAGDGAVFPPEYVTEMAGLQKQFDAWNEWQLRRAGFRPAREVPGLDASAGSAWVRGL